MKITILIYKKCFHINLLNKYIYIQIVNVNSCYFFLKIKKKNFFFLYDKKNLISRDIRCISSNQEMHEQVVQCYTLPGVRQITIGW